MLVGFTREAEATNKQTNKEEVRRLHQTAGQSRIHNASVNGGTSSSVVFQMIISLCFLVKKIENQIFLNLAFQIQEVIDVIRKH